MKPAFPLVSVCIPVFETEAYLAQCLRSVFTQNFEAFEVIVASDASRGKDEKGCSAKKITALAQKECRVYRKQNGLAPVSIRFVENSENRGCVEIRRTLVYEAKGKYIAMLDSDDELMEGALTTMYEAALSNSADIVHGEFVSGWYDELGKFTPSKINKCGAIFYGIKEGSDIVRSWLSNAFNGNVCGKLILRELYEKAFAEIPYTECNMADDVLIFFFAAINASRYVGIEKTVYRYRIDSGMSSCRKIDTLKKWEMICTASSVFTIISTWVQENAKSAEKTAESILSEKDIANIGLLAASYVVNNLHQLKLTVVPELYDEAKKMLCDFWGENLVQNIAEAMENQL